TTPGCGLPWSGRPPPCPTRKPRLGPPWNENWPASWRRSGRWGARDRRRLFLARRLCLGVDRRLGFVGAGLRGHARSAGRVVGRALDDRARGGARCGGGPGTHVSEPRPCRGASVAPAGGGQPRTPAGRAGALAGARPGPVGAGARAPGDRRRGAGGPTALGHRRRARVRGGLHTALARSHGAAAAAPVSRGRVVALG